MDYYPGMRAIPTSEITPNDVLCGRGGNINSHPGNERFRQMVDSKKRLYLTSRFKREKRLIACSIVDEINALNGRFLAKIYVSGSKRGRKKAPDPGWYEVDIEKAREKTSQALRENATEIRKELNAEEGTAATQNEDSRQQDNDYYRMEQHEEEMSTNGSKCSKPQQSNADNDCHSWIQEFQEIHMSNSWNSFKSDLASFSSLSMVIPLTGSRSSFSEFTHKSKPNEQLQVGEDPMKTPNREKGSDIECHPVKPCHRKKYTGAPHMYDYPNSTNGMMLSPDHPSILPPPPQPKRKIMHDWNDGAAFDSDYNRFGHSSSMSYNMEVEMENTASMALVEIPAKQPKSNLKKDEEIVERSWFPCTSWAPAEWTNAIFSCGPAVYKADSFEYVSDSLCDGIEVVNPCSMYLKNEPHNSPYGFDHSTDIVPSMVQSTPSFNCEDMQMEDRFMGGSLPSVTEKSHRSEPEQSLSDSGSMARDIILRRSVVDDRQDVSRMEPIKWAVVKNEAGYLKPNHQSNDFAFFDDGWSNRRGRSGEGVLRMQG